MYYNNFGSSSCDLKNEYFRTFMLQIFATRFADVGIYDKCKHYADI